MIYAIHEAIGVTIGVAPIDGERDGLFGGIAGCIGGDNGEGIAGLFFVIGIAVECDFSC